MITKEYIAKKINDIFHDGMKDNALYFKAGFKAGVAWIKEELLKYPDKTVKELFPDEFFIHKIGNFYKKKGGENIYILSNVNYNYVNLIGVSTGERINNNVCVKSIYDITNEEFEELTNGYDFEFVGRSEDIIKIINPVG